MINYFKILEFILIYYYFYVGIAGFIKSKKENGLNQKTLMMMLKTLDHRGPDFKDYWIERNVYLGHTRLSIIDISEKGNQPMVSHSGRFVIIFNGEIYNFKDLKLKLENQKKILIGMVILIQKFF